MKSFINHNILSCKSGSEWVSSHLLIPTLIKADSWTFSLAELLTIDDREIENHSHYKQYHTRFQQRSVALSMGEWFNCTIDNDSWHWSPLSGFMTWHRLRFWDFFLVCVKDIFSHFSLNTCKAQKASSVMKVGVLVNVACRPWYDALELQNDAEQLCPIKKVNFPWSSTS